jgi:outer membrane protein assembly factor BamB
LIGALRTRHHVAVAVAVTAGALVAATLTWRHDHPNRDGRVVVLDARTGRIVGERRTRGGWVAVALLARRRVAVADGDRCVPMEIRIYDDHLRLVRRAPPTTSCIVISQPNELRARLQGTSIHPLTGWSQVQAGSASHTLGRGTLVVGVSGALHAYSATGHLLWQKTLGRPAGLAAVGQGLVVVTVAGSYSLPVE